MSTRIEDKDVFIVYCLLFIVSAQGLYWISIQK